MNFDISAALHVSFAYKMKSLNVEESLLSKCFSPSLAPPL